MGLKESTKQDDIPLRLVYNGVPNTFAHQLMVHSKKEIR